MQKAEGRMKKAEAPLSPQAARLAAQSQIANRESRIPWLLALMLVLVTIALYWPATQGNFVNYDDPDFYVTANPHVQNGLSWESIRWACLNPVAANWHPLTVLVPHDGLPSVRFESLGASFDQRAAARPQRGAGVRVAATD